MILPCAFLTHCCVLAIILKYSFMDEIFVSCFSLLLVLLFSVVFVSLVYGKLGVKQASSLR